MHIPPPIKLPASDKLLPPWSPQMTVVTDFLHSTHIVANEPWCPTNLHSHWDTLCIFKCQRWTFAFDDASYCSAWFISQSIICLNFLVILRNHKACSNEDIRKNIENSRAWKCPNIRKLKNEVGLNCPRVAKSKWVVGWLVIHRWLTPERRGHWDTKLWMSQILLSLLTGSKRKKWPKTLLSVKLKEY